MTNFSTLAKMASYSMNQKKPKIKRRLWKAPGPLLLQPTAQTGPSIFSNNFNEALNE